jgi:hypothetical protein
MNQVPDLRPRIAKAIAHYWRTRRRQSRRQKASGQHDQGARGAVTGGAHMNEFVVLFTELLVEAGVDRGCIFYETALELPGFFRPTKKWDLLVVRQNQLLVALEAKSQTGPSFGNNFNNRTEEAMGSAVDLWTAYREGAFNKSTRPWLGYLFLLERCDASQRSVAVAEPHFPVFPEFKDASYARRYELFCRKLARERHYDATAFLLADAISGAKGSYTEPADDLTFVRLAKSLSAHVSANWSLT